MHFRRTFIALAAALAAAVALPGARAADAPTPEKAAEITKALTAPGSTVFPIGVENAGNAKYFTGESFVAGLTPAGASVRVSNVTFAPGTINYWHTHQGTCQVLIGVSGRGWYQIEGEEPKEILPGVTVTIPENTRHWHGAAAGSWFQHLAAMSAGGKTTWMEPVDPAVYAKLR